MFVGTKFREKVEYCFFFILKILFMTMVLVMHLQIFVIIFYLCVPTDASITCIFLYGLLFLNVASFYVIDASCQQIVIFYPALTYFVKTNTAELVHTTLLQTR